MPQDLAEITDRLNYCETKLLPEADTQIKQYFKEAVETDYLETSAFKTFRMRLKFSPPSRLISAARLPVHEARAVLDSLACRLAERNGATNVSDVYFPLMKTKDIFDDSGVKRIKRLSCEDQKTITDLKPWGGGGSDFLYAMHDFDRSGKHDKLFQAKPNLGGLGLNEGSWNIITTCALSELSGEWTPVAVLSKKSWGDINPLSELFLKTLLL